MSKGYILDESLYFDIELYVDIFDDESGSINYGELNISFIIKKNIFSLLFYF